MPACLTSRHYARSSLTVCAAAFCWLAAAVSAAASITSSFDVDAEGWVAVNGGDLTHRAAGGNPDGFVEIVDAETLTFLARAPAKFLGDLSGFDGGTLSFDAIALTPAVPAEGGFGTVLLEGLNGTSVQLDLGSPASEWTTYSAPLTAASWGLAPADWQALLADVIRIDIVLEHTNGTDSTGFDNFTLVAAPEPRAAALMVAALAVAVFSYLRRS